jgi:DNA polymerase-3 subunit alpha
VINDIGRVLEIPLTKINQFVKMVPDDYRTTLDSALKGNSKFADAYQKDSDCKRILNNAFVLEGLPRSAGVHAAGVVISEKPLIEILPLCRDKEGSQVTQYTMDSVGEVGLLKMDFLGFMIPTILQKATEMIRMNRGVTVNLDRLPLDDKPTYKLLNSGRTAGIFLLESKGMQNLIREGGIGNIEDLMALFAMYRPGLMAMLPEYIARKTGKGKNTYDHPLLEPILKDTYGIMIYQEQVQTAANVLAGYTLGAADKLRRTLCKLKKGETAKERNTFISGCLRVNKIAQDKAGRIFDTLTEFAPYGFNKAHAAAYALLSYQTAYMKAHYPVEFKKAVASVEAERRK